MAGDNGATGRLGDNAALAGMALAKLGVHLAFITQYGYFRDEFYYLACGRHLDWGYVDFPPFIGLLGAFLLKVLGDSLVAIRIFPALAGAGMVFVTGLIAREFGGKRFAQCMAALCALIAPVLLGTQHFFGVNAFEQFFWVLAVYIFVRILRTEVARLWLLFGVVAGVGLMTKLTFLFFGVSILIALVLTPNRKALATPWPWLGGVIAFLIFLPYVAWQAIHGWPTLQMTGDYAAGKTYQASILEAVYMQVVAIHPLALPVWGAGMYFFFRDTAGKRFRAIGWSFVFLAVVFTALTAKFYWLAPSHCAILAAGACVIERVTAARKWRWMKVAYPAALLIGGALLAPLALPILPVKQAIAYHALFGGDAGLKHGRVTIRGLPQHFADMFGWPEMVAQIARIYDGLPDDEKARCIIFGDNYGVAGAVDLLGKAHGLPSAISTHHNYHLWGPGDVADPVVIAVTRAEDQIIALFDEVTLVDRTSHPYCIPHENDKPIYVCRRLKMRIEEVWPGPGGDLGKIRMGNNSVTRRVQTRQCGESTESPDARLNGRE